MFRYSMTDPLKSEPVDMGTLHASQILDVFDQFPWQELVEKERDASQEDVHYSASIEFENIQTRHGVTISIVPEANPEYYIFYKRPKLISNFFGLFKRYHDQYVSDHMHQTLQDARTAVEALVTGDIHTLEKRWG